MEKYVKIQFPQLCTQTSTIVRNLSTSSKKKTQFPQLCTQPSTIIRNLRRFGFCGATITNQIESLQEEVIVLRSDYKKLNDKFIETLENLNED